MPAGTSPGVSIRGFPGPPANLYLNHLSGPHLPDPDKDSDRAQ